MNNPVIIPDIIKANLHKQMVNPDEFTMEQFEDYLFKGEYDVLTINQVENDLRKAAEDGAEAFEKAKRDVSKLAKKIITDKRGHRRTVYVKRSDEKKKVNSDDKIYGYNDIAKQFPSDKFELMLTQVDNYNKNWGVDTVSKLTVKKKTGEVNKFGRELLEDKPTAVYLEVSDNKYKKQQ